MPYVSQAQRGWMHVNEPEIAKKWDRGEHTSRPGKFRQKKNLPYHVRASKRKTKRR